MATSVNHVNHTMTPPPTSNGILTPDLSLEPSTQSTPSTFDVSVFRTYLLNLLPPVLGATIHELEDSLFDSDFEERVTKFANEPSVVVYILKKKEDVNGLFFFLLLQDVLTV